MNPQLFEVIGSFVEAIPDNLQQWKRMRNFVLKIGKQGNRTRKENRTWERPSDLIGLRGADASLLLPKAVAKAAVSDRCTSSVKVGRSLLLYGMMTPEMNPASFRCAGARHWLC